MTAGVAGGDGTVVAPHGMVASVDHLASGAGVAMLRAGGSAADAAVAANAVLAVTTQHMCGMGGDLFAVVHAGPGPHRTPVALSAAGPAGSGADAAALRAEGHDRMPFLRDIRSVTVPGCVDGWLALHERYGRLPLADVLAPAREYAATGFPASPLLARATPRIRDVPGADDYLPPGGLRPGDRVLRPLVAATLDAIARDGRAGFYGGAFGRGLLALGEGLFAAGDLARSVARWEDPLLARAFGHDVWTTAPPSQGYLLLAGARIADGLPVPGDADDGAWVHLLSEAARYAGHDRPDVLFDGADGPALLAEDRLDARRAAIDPGRRTAPPAPAAAGGTMYLCAVDADRMAVSLIQSNASGWGAGIVVPGTGVFLQNRGIGFTLEHGHPAEWAPGRRPPHTLVPAIVTRDDGSFAAALGTQGGDIQPQVLLQLLSRMLQHGDAPGAAVRAPRWILGDGGFSSWAGDGPQTTTLEHGSPPSWRDGLARRGHRVVIAEPGFNVGHAQVIAAEGGMLAGTADHRALTGAAIGF